METIARIRVRPCKTFQQTGTFVRSGVGAAVSSALFIMVFLVAVTLPAVASAAREPIGVVRNSGGAATVTRGDTLLPAAVGTKLLAGDTLNTGPDGSLGVIFRDDSSLSLGPGSSLVIQSFRFEPSAGKYGLLVRMAKGSMAYLSGLIGKLAPGSVRFDTPSASIGIRGTHFAVKVGDPASP